MNNQEVIEEMKKLVTQLEFNMVDGEVITDTEVLEYHNIDKILGLIKKHRDARNKNLKERLLPNQKRAIAGYDVWVSLSERTTLNTKALKADYPKIYETYGKTSEVKTLNIKESM